VRYASSYGGFNIGHLMSFELAREALIASGLKEDDRIRAYLGKLQCLYMLILSNVSLSDRPLTRAKQLFNWLWHDRPNRYQRKGCYRLHEVIDSQLSKDKESVGNCLGLTIIYNYLLAKAGIRAKAVNLEYAFGVAPHVLTHLKTKYMTIDIENILLNGFDYKGHLDNPSRTLWGDTELVADIYHSRGNDCFARQDFHSALANYDLALKLNPQYEKARINRGILLDRMGTGTV
jgi:tetratricopeptide (TPR) repeat protein